MTHWREHIVSDPDILLGKPVIKGTRLSVEHIVQLLAQGWTEDQLLDNYPRLQREDLLAVFSYIHDCIRDGLLFESPKPG
jgi:uncharacterized protein (DUF433 family)